MGAAFRRPDHEMIVVAAIIEDEGAFLVTRRQKGVHLAGLWEFPGGKMDEGETQHAALAREIRRELAAGDSAVASPGETLSKLPSGPDSPF